ncbi:MAG: iron ABC transporter permease [Betaproteobacteria bacterium RIFCSPLOWO2_12_FULL_62_13]|nr:MAG: iron ABC transporter permease [Betaproteobacteria bacterium RIFCSPLOWO2_12_FULL_62_13]
MNNTALATTAPTPLSVKRPGTLSVLAVSLAVLLAVPVVVVVLNVFVPSEGTWSHLAATVLPEYIVNSLGLMLGVAYGVITIGITTAWLTTMCRFPGRRLLEWALLLPMAVPAYVMAYAYTDFLQFAGPVQSLLREWTGWGPGDYWFPDVRSLWGAVAMLSFVLYPYVYLLARAAFLEQSDSMLEVARGSGYGPWRSFFRVALPLARPGIVAGTALALMETLADFGTVAYFGVHTFTTGIYRAWFSLGDHVAAAQLSATLLGFVFAVLLIERLSRGRASFHNTVQRKRLDYPYRMRGFKALIALIACAIPLMLGFFLPAGILLHMAVTSGDAQFGAHYVDLTFNTMTLAGVTAGLAVVLALLVGYAARSTSSRLVSAANRIAGLGYAVPGAVIAVGVLIPVTRLDHAMAAAIESMTGASPGLLLTGGIAALVYAYLVRFFALSLQTIEAGLTKITPSMDCAARSLGLGPASTLARVHAPLLWRSALIAGLLVFVDVMKELPATFVMRPFNFDTLAVQAFNLASDERLTEASTAALTIVAVGLVPLIVLSRMLLRPRNGST